VTEAERKVFIKATNEDIMHWARLYAETGDDEYLIEMRLSRAIIVALQPGPRAPRPPRLLHLKVLAP
jgi:hypothetical protein